MVQQLLLALPIILVAIPAFINILLGLGLIRNDIDGEYVGDYSGTSVSLSDDGSIVAIGADRNDGNGNIGGHTRIYHSSDLIRGLS